jgi:hypothetical protein
LVSFDDGSFEVPASWQPGDPAAWCGESPAHAPRYTVSGDGGSISIGCFNPQIWYGASVRPTSSSTSEQSSPIQYESTGGKPTYPEHAWVATAPVGDEWTLIVVAASRKTATTVVNSLKLTN